MIMRKNSSPFSEIHYLNEPLITRDYLAIERTKLANERTLFSYIRTSLYLVTVGVGVLQVAHKERLKILAWACISVGIIIFCAGWIRYYQLRKELKKFYTH
ncbi:MAG: DUF202 domain-containing protein [Rikenellaceae bacterium]|nr:DUF202 domain-containing protein [Rikenellaceae bacterium]